ncbi:MAG: hypothetical protein AAFX79_01815 [Planctomycetota bacterium]
MLCLCIEATNPSIPTPGVLLARIDADGRPEVLGERHLATKSGRHDDPLMPAIAEACGGVPPSDVDEVLVSIGPGGFTATRIACATAATLAELAGAALLACPAALVAARGGGAAPGRAAIVLLAGKRDTAYATRVDGSMTAAGRTVDADGFADLVEAGDAVLADEHLPEPIAERARQLGLAIEPISLTPRGLLACRPVAARIDPAHLRPIYPREPEAVTQWRARHGRAPGD